MNRNAGISIALVGVFLAAVAVGVSTFMSNISLEERAESITNDAAALEESLVDEIQAVELRTSEMQETFLVADGGQATNLASVTNLWSKGRLLVTDVADDEAQLFVVDPAMGANGTTIVNSALRVSRDAEMGDVVAGAVQATELRADGFANRQGTWKVDRQGTMNADGDLIVGRNAEVAGNLSVGGGSFNVGQDVVFTRDYRSRDGFLSELNGQRVFVVDGTIVASSLRTSGKTGFEFSEDVILHRGILASSRQWSVLQDGTATFQRVSAGDVTLQGKITVAGPASVTGTVTAGGAAMGSTGVDVGTTRDVRGRDLIAHNELRLGSSAFRVASTGAIGASSAVLTGDLSAAGANFTDTVTAGSVDAGGSLIGATGVNVGTTRDVRGRDLIAYDGLLAAERLAVGPSSSPVFVVAQSTRTATLEGTLRVTGDASITGDLDVTGDISAANLPNVRQGVHTVSGGTVTVSVPGMPGSAVVVITPYDVVSGFYHISNRDAGEFTITADDDVSFGWIATW